MNTPFERKKKKLTRIYDSFKLKYRELIKIDECSEKWNKENSRKRRQYINLDSRIHKLAFKIQYPKNPFSSDTFLASLDWKYRLERKEEKRKEFESKHKYAPHFMQTTLGADYGQFTCDRCRGMFYHSPSTITRGSKTIYECCCGHCTNTLIYSDWNKEPYF